MEDDHNVLEGKWMENWLKENTEAAHYVDEFTQTSTEAIPILKEYVDVIPEICEKLQEWIDDLQVQETAVNATNTTVTAATAVSTVLLFTPFAVFGVGALAVSGIAAAATAAGDGIANHVKGKGIEKVVNEKKDLLEKAEKCMAELDNLIKKVADVGKISTVTASKICFSLTGVARAAAAARVIVQGDRLARLMGLYNVWRAGQLAPGGVAAIRGVAGAGSKLFGSLGVVVGVWTTIDGWVNGNPTRNLTIEMKKKFEESMAAIKQLIAILEGKTVDASTVEEK